MRVQFTALGRKATDRIKPFAQTRHRLEDYTQDFAERVVDVVKQYPPVPSLNYQRTYKLFRSWRVINASRGSEIRYQITNYATDPYQRPYAGLVVGQNTQLPLHASHGWRNIGAVIEQLGGRDRFRRGAQDIITAQMGAV